MWVCRRLFGSGAQFARFLSLQRKCSEGAYSSLTSPRWPCGRCKAQRESAGIVPQKTQKRLRCQARCQWQPFLWAHSAVCFRWYDSKHKMAPGLWPQWASDATMFFGGCFKKFFFFFNRPESLQRCWNGPIHQPPPQKKATKGATIVHLERHQMFIGTRVKSNEYSSYLVRSNL